jgi:hypothetical protein
VVRRDRVGVVRELPSELVAEVERAGLERLVQQEPERREEEDREPCESRREQEIGNGAAMPVEEAQLTLR